MPAPVHFAPSDHVNTGGFLFENRGLHRAHLRVGEVAIGSCPSETSRSSASYHRGTLCAPITVVV